MLQPHPLRPSTVDATLHLPAVDRLDALEVVGHVIRLIDGDAHDSAAPSHAEAFVMIVPFIEALLDDDPDDVSLALVAQLVVITTLPGLPEAIALQIAFGRRIGEQHTLKIGRLMARARQRGLSVDEYVARLGPAAAERDTLLRLFHGEARRRPDANRMQRGIALLRRTAALVPAHERPAVLCVIAWLHWARGHRAIAMAYLAEAARIEPQHILAYGLSWLVTTKTPVWLTDATVTPGP